MLCVAHVRTCVAQRCSLHGTDGFALRRHSSAILFPPAAEKAAKQARKERLLHKQAPPHAQQALFGNGSLLQLQQQLIGLVSAPHACSSARPPALPVRHVVCAPAHRYAGGPRQA